MPYIKQEARKGIMKLTLDELVPNNGGELQYIIAELIHAYLMEKGLNYQHCQDMLGALSGAQTEFYRCVVAPYEDQKIIENGPVYDSPQEYPKPSKY